MKSKVIMLFFLIVTLCTSQEARADYGSIALTGVVVSKLLNQFEDMANRLMAQGQIAGNSMIAKTGDELRVATANVAIAFQDQREKTFDQLSVQEKQVFLELNKMIESVNDSATKVTSALELASLDLQDLLNRVPLIAEKKIFFIRSVDGITLPYNGNKIVTLRGLGFGYDDDKRKYIVSVKIAGYDIPVVNMSRPDAYTLQVTVPNSSLLTSYKDHDLSMVPIVMTSKIIEPHWYGDSEK